MTSNQLNSLNRHQIAALLGNLSRSASPQPQLSLELSTALPLAAIDTGHVDVLREALIEACEFVGAFSAVGPAKRREMALCIVRHAQNGMQDPHRLAVKAIARAG